MKTKWEKMKILNLISIFGVAACVGLTGCSSNLAAHADGSPTVASAYESAMRGETRYTDESSDGEESDTPSESISRLSLPDPTYHSEASSQPVMQTLDSQFPTLPNPQSKMYIFGHFAGNGEIPVAGHFVPFSLYTRNYYALPNEVLMPYNDGQFVPSESTEQTEKEG